MVELDPYLLEMFRSKIANPKHWREVFELLRTLEPEDVKNRTRVGKLVDNLANILQVRLTKAQRANAVNWIVSQHLNPKNPADALRLWQLVYGK